MPKSHFGQSQKDIDQILTSTGKITKRSTKIESMDFQDSASQDGTNAVEKSEKANDPEPLSVVKPIGASGRLNLRP